MVMALIENAVLTQQIAGGLGNRQTHSAMNIGAVGLESLKLFKVVGLTG